MTLQALDIFDPSSYPTRRDEEWKYSDLSRVLREAPKNRRGDSFSSSIVPAWGIAFPAESAAVARHLMVKEGDYSQLKTLEFGDFTFLRLTETNLYGLDRDRGHQANADIEVSAGKTLFLVEEYLGSSTYVAHTTLHFKLAEGATLIRVSFLDEPEEAISIRRSTVTTSPGSTFKQYVFSTGAKFQRFETHVEHAGHGAHVELHGAYLLNGRRHFDLTTRVRHLEGQGTTEQLIKGLVKDQATAVFQGRILVERGADGTDARMRHQALMLNDGAHIRAKPELEIYADDVQCAHGNTIGALDQDALFFCQSRGMDDATARALLTQAFILPVADQIEDEDLRGIVLKFLQEKSEAFHAL